MSQINSFPINTKTIPELSTGTVALDSVIPVSIDGVTKKVTVQSVLALGGGGGGGSATVGLYLPYKFKTGTTPPPLDGYIKFNNATHNASTQIYISMINEDNYDIDLILQNILPDDIIYIQDRDNSANVLKFQINSSTGTHVDGYHTLSVTNLSGSYTFSNNHQLFLYFVRIIPEPSLSDLSDVVITSVADNQVLSYDNGTLKWVNVSLATVALTGQYTDLSGKPDLSVYALQTDLQNEIDARQDADALLAPLDSPALVNVPTAPTALLGTQTTQIATTEFVQNALNAAPPQVSTWATTDDSTVIGLTLATVGDLACYADGTLKRLTALPSSTLGNWTLVAQQDTDLISEGTTNLYFNENRVRATVLTGFATGTNSTILNTDTITQAFGKAQTQINNARNLTSTYVGFGNAGVLDGSSNLIYSSGSLYIKNGGYLVGDADANTVDISYGRIRINGGTKVTGDGGASFKIKETWNDATMIGYTFVTNITDTASDINSLIQLANVNSAPIWQVRKDAAISMGVNSATPWKDGVGAMIAIKAAATQPTTSAITDSAVVWYNDTDKRFKYIDDTATTHTIPNKKDTTQAQTASSGITLTVGEWLMVSGYGVAPKMPSTPSTGDRILVTDIGGTAQSSPITLDGNGNNFIGGDYSASSTFSIDLDYGKASFVYNGTLWVANIA